VPQLDRRQALRLFGALGLAGAAAPVLSACSSDPSDEDDPVVVHSGPPIKIGMIVPQTGALKPYGDDLANGFQLYLRQNGNKLGGRTVNLVTADEGDTADSSRKAADGLIKNEQVVALTGVVNPDGLLAMKDLVDNAHVPLIGSNASPVNLGSTPYIWRTSFIPNEPSEALGRWVTENAQGQVAIVAADSANKDEVKGFTEAFGAANGTLAGAPHYTPLNTGGYSAALAAVKTSGASAMFCFYPASAAVDFVKQIKAAGFPSDFKIFAPGTLTEGALLKQQGDAARNIYTAMNYSPDLDNATNRRFVADYQKAYNTIPSAFAVASFDAAMVIDKAINEVDGDLNPPALNAALGRLGQFDSPRGTWQFTANRAPLQKWYLRQVRTDGNVLSNVLTAELTTLG
jgi:branched-chain amino acid transport system substrate-binding protein